MYALTVSRSLSRSTNEPRNILRISRVCVRLRRMALSFAVFSPRCSSRMVGSNQSHIFLLYSKARAIGASITIKRLTSNGRNSNIPPTPKKRDPNDVAIAKPGIRASYHRPGCLRVNLCHNLRIKRLNWSRRLMRGGRIVALTIPVSASYDTSCMNGIRNVSAMTASLRRSLSCWACFIPRRNMRLDLSRYLPISLL